MAHSLLKCKPKHLKFVGPTTNSPTLFLSAVVVSLHFVCVFLFSLCFTDVRTQTPTNTVALQSMNECSSSNCIRRMAIWIVRLIFNATTECFVAILWLFAFLFIVDKLHAQPTNQREPSASPRATTKFRLMFPFCFLPRKINNARD